MNRSRGGTSKERKARGLGGTKAKSGIPRLSGEKRSKFWRRAKEFTAGECPIIQFQTFERQHTGSS